MSTEAKAVAVTTFGMMPDGTPVQLFTVRDGKFSASFTSFGARVVSLVVPDAKGVGAEVVMGFDSLDAYLADKSYQGAIVGRVGNRIANGKFSLDGKAFSIPQNNGTNALHGGPEGYDLQLWSGKEIENGVEFTLVSPDGDMGFPGALTVTVRYTLSGGALRIEYTATSDAPTVVNLTNHAFFNLLGEQSDTILAHELLIPADRITPVNANLIPTGELAPVEGTPFDFREWKVIGERIDADDEQLKLAGGYDHNWVFGEDGTLKTVAWLRAGGRLMKVETTEPGVQFYAGNFLDGKALKRGGNAYVYRSALCLETQHYPDSPNQPEFPSTVLRPGETLRSTTVYSFSTVD